MRTFLAITIIVIMTLVLVINFIGLGRDLGRQTSIGPRLAAIAINVFMTVSIIYIYTTDPGE